MKLSDLLEIEYGSQNLLQTYQDQIKEIDPEQYRKLQLMMSQQQDNEVAKWITNALESGKLEHIDDLPPDDKALAKIREYIKENLRNWFKKEKWKRIDTQGNIAGDCGTMPKGKKTQRCLPQAKAQSLTKKQRAATSRKKTKSNKQFVSNTKAAK